MLDRSPARRVLPLPGIALLPVIVTLAALAPLAWTFLRDPLVVALWEWDATLNFALSIGGVILLSGVWLFARTRERQFLFVECVGLGVLAFALVECADVANTNALRLRDLLSDRRTTISVTSDYVMLYRATPRPPQEELLLGARRLVPRPSLEVTLLLSLEQARRATHALQRSAMGADHSLARRL